MVIRKHRLFWVLAFLGVVTGALLLVGRAQADSIGFSLVDRALPGAPADVAVTVFDDTTLAPINDASVSVSNSLTPDLSAPSQRTDSTGVARFGSLGARATLRTVTVSKEGYSSISVVGVQTLQVSIYLKPLPPTDQQPVIASGSMTGFPDSLGGDTITAGVVFPALSALDLLHFDTTAFVSPLKDQIDVMGSHNIPSNLIIPDQDIFVLFAPVTLSKPTYRLPVTPGHPLRLTGIQGQVTVDDLISLLQGGGHLSMDLLNKLTITRVGLTAPVTPSADFSQDVSATTDLAPAHRVSPSMPPFDADVIVAAATDLTGDRSVLMPTDVKLAGSAGSGYVSPVSLSSVSPASGQERTVITVALANKGAQLSGIVTPTAGATVQPGQFLASNAISDAAAVPNSVSLASPRTGVGAVVFEGALRSGAAFPRWYVYSLPAAGNVTVPTQSVAASGLASYSVMQFDFGPSFSEKAVDGRAIMKQLQRFVRSSAKISGQ